VTTSYSGHADAEAALLEALRGERLHPVWLLSGPQGLGKAAFALRAASFVLADGDHAAHAGATSIILSEDHPTARLVASGAHGELLTLEREEDDNGKLARNITVKQVRALIGSMRAKPVASRWRVVIIDSIDDCERGAANALLKTLEEPPDNTLIFLISHAPGRLLPTIRSRCRSLRFAPLDPAAMERVLRDHLPSAAPTEIAELIALGGGAPGRALGFAQGNIAETAATLRAIAATGDADNRLRSDLARQLALAAARPRFEAMLEQAAALAAEAARTRQGQDLAAALTAYDRIAEIRRFALASSEDPATVTFAIGSALAGLCIRETAG
jgi:DNA polymerase III subunit delta'